MVSVSHKYRRYVNYYAKRWMAIRYTFAVSLTSSNIIYYTAFLAVNVVKFTSVKLADVRLSICKTARFAERFHSPPQYTRGNILTNCLARQFAQLFPLVCGGVFVRISPRKAVCGERVNRAQPDYSISQWNWITCSRGLNSLILYNLSQYKGE